MRSSLHQAVILSVLSLPAVGIARQGFSAPQTEPMPPSAPLAASAVTLPGSQEHRVWLDVVATDKAGTPASGLQAGDFTLLDNRLPTKILSFRESYPTMQKTPVEFILLLDSVNVGFQYVANARQQIDEFLKQNGGHLAQPVSLVWLNEDGFSAPIGPFSDGAALMAQLDASKSRLRTLNRSTGLWGAVERFQFSVEKLHEFVQMEAAKPGRKVVVWLGPGWPMLDGSNLDLSAKSQDRLFQYIVRLSGEIREARVTLYSVSVGMPNMRSSLYEAYLKGVKSSRQANFPNLSMRVLAVQSGGLALGPSNDLTAQLNRCIAEAAAFYTLSFEVPRADRADEYHEIKLQIGKPGLAARTSTGYYNQP